MRVALIEIGYIEVKRSAKQRLAKAEDEKLCVACMKPLGEGRVKRGCHERCYRATLRAIEKGQLTLADRLADGKILEAGDGGRRPSNPVSIEAAGE